MTGSIAGDGRNYEVRNPEKLVSLKNLILKKADDEREALLESARQEAASWLAEQSAALDHMVEQIHTEAMKRAEEISKRQISGAETALTKERLRLQNSLLEEAVGMLQKELTALRIHPSYPAVLAGLALEAAEKLPAGTEVKIQLASEDEALGEPLAARLREKRPDLSFSFDPNPAPILGGVWLSAPDGSWRSPADWREVIAEVKDSLAERILSIL
ncbi:V-type ATP synthase subunit E [Aminivibrio sp.]|jgi:V/A-type H+-transporting ATPase subunit E|uniref:V-type ATP synthase subunit E n=1 Tax=Aminivibrio sp. TaxID=1872489 RepID=UPI001A443335|nr:V-type ATP synthase subunit E [Aminivibrio sp.]MBL3540046.1 V-type ATP synthase subunit E [Aminivibrio sp.]MDK2958862.1 V/A-type H+/Na+-transporting ATPase subunit [Synergistaceae bacterium]